LSFWALPELLAQTKVDVVGPVPLDLGGFTTQSVGILTSSGNPDAAQAFIEFLNSSDGRAIWTKSGLLPLQGAPE
jgi:ABC-type molybdate transport system substrate-binding protein